MNVPKLPQSTSDAKPWKDRGGPPSLEATFLKLALVGIVEALVDDKGFGFVTCDSRPGEHFFHITTNLTGLRDFGGMAEGNHVLFQLGSNPRKPGQICAVRWVRIDDLDWGDVAPPKDQQALDALRRDALHQRSLNDLRNRVRADWYAKLWAGEAPADLHDPVLGEALREHLSRLDPETLQKARVPDLLQQSRYDFAARLDPASDHCSVLDLLAAFSPAQLAVLGSPQNAWLESPLLQDRPSVGGLLPGEKRQDPLDPDQKSALLEWFVLGCALREPSDGYDGWLNGGATYEAAVAERVLARGQQLPRAVMQWIAILANKGGMSQLAVDYLATLDLAGAASLFGRLSTEAQFRTLAAWKQSPDLLAEALRARPELASEIAICRALAIDLETDGARIWEIGCAQGQDAVRLYDETAGTELSAAVNDLAGRVRTAPVIVGHNILAWDWPILAPRLALEASPLIWDTLLVQYLLEPQARTHALGGNHHAEGDAAVTLALFAQQLGRLPAEFTVQLLTGQFASAADLLQGVAAALTSDGAPSRPVPQFLRDPDHAPARVLLLPDRQLAAVNWVPGAAAVQVDPGKRLRPALWQIDVALLAAELTADHLQGPGALVLLAVVQRANAAGIAMRRGMVPTWLLQGDLNLSAAVDRACVIPDGAGQIRVSPLPDTAEWWAHADHTAVRAALPEGRVLIIDRKAALDDRMAQVALQHPSALLLFSAQAEGRWAAYPDRPA